MSASRKPLALLSADRLRAVALALRQDVGSFDAITDPDSALVELVNEQFASIPEAEERLTLLERRLRDRGDRRAVFLSIYVRMTRQVRDELGGDRFANPKWMRQYLLTFVEYYRRAFLAYEQGRVGAVPNPWRIAFGTAIRGDSLVLQDAFLGVNAHINYDLALTIRDIGIDSDRHEKYRDHARINAILGQLVDAQQTMLANLYAGGIDEIDAALGRLDETFTLISMTEGREQAWRMAVVLTDFGWQPIRGAATRFLNLTATGGALFILSPSLYSTVLADLRRIEQDQFDPAEIIDRFYKKAVDWQ